MGITIRRIIKAGFLNFKRNTFVSLTAVVVMVVTLSVITSTIFMGAVLEVALSEIQERVDVRVVFNVDAPASEIRELQNALSAREDVSEVLYTSREEALRRFEDRHQDDETVLQALRELEENPLGASLSVQATKPSDFRNIVPWLEQSSFRTESDIIDTINYEDNREAIENLTGFMDGVERFGLVATIVLIIISVLISFNTIRLTIHAARDEIAVMRLVGASAGYIRGPFVVSGVIYGLVASVLTLTAFYPLTYWLGDLTSAYFGGLDLFQYYQANFSEIVVLVLVAGIFIGAVSSYLAVKRYLKV